MVGSDHLLLQARKMSGARGEREEARRAAQQPGLHGRAAHASLETEAQFTEGCCPHCRPGLPGTKARGIEASPWHHTRCPQSPAHHAGEFFSCQKTHWV